MLRRFIYGVLVVACVVGRAQNGDVKKAVRMGMPTGPSHADLLRGGYGPYRANNDLLFYHLDVRVDPEAKTIRGKNTIRFRMLQDGERMQIDLTSALQVDRIVMGDVELKYTRDAGAVFIGFPETLRVGKTYAIDFYYSGHPVEMGRFGCMAFRKDPAQRPWVTTACEDEGASMWWPNKDQWRDEPQEGMEISVEAPSALMDVSNGRLEGKKVLSDGYTRWDWRVHYPINNYDVVVNIGDYVHFGSKVGSLTLDYYVLPEDLDKAKAQFAQAPEMIRAFEHYVGPYPFMKERYKLMRSALCGDGAPECGGVWQWVCEWIFRQGLDGNGDKHAVRLHHRA